ncbi:geranylgeranyl-diphosphate geranylgeranyltransferase [Haladaptatus sp. R4]|uniref:phytoene/squalene synthase family protein n=1 Tax=Haladaptatus sp. R4 TaxID=1679489 RepID=UPI0007B4D50A|nr:phytoene/squalene synthase family protein [Haladaptatus sp. R4]KZN26359.1 geranylgeranyl-diphosphate geranylgeranyltransferase [Haladaptatus sp. R4]
MKDTHVEAGKAIQQQTGKTFHLATRLLPERVRHPTYVLYGFFRICDEVVDDAADVPPEEQSKRLESLRNQALGSKPPDDPVLEAFNDLRESHGISDEEVAVFIDAMAADIEKSRYENYEELEAYMRGSAAAVGQMMTSVMNPANPDRARPHATALGEAFQLTNFLRDVREDVEDRDRIYLPRTTRERHGVTDEQIERLEFTDGFAAVMHDELRRAEALYREGVAGIQYLPEDCQFAVLLAAVLYAEYHRVIRAQGYDVLSREPSFGTTRKLVLLAKTRWHWRKTGDPETVFRAVSPVGTPEHRGSDVERRDTLPTR